MTVLILGLPQSARG